MTTDAAHLHNFHTHTMRCKHAQGDVADYCEAALAGGMQTLGFSDHSALPDDRWLSARMLYEHLGEYVGAVRAAQAEYPALDILLAMECEYLPEFHNWYEDELFGTYGFDYLAGGPHFFPDDGEWKGTYGGTTDARTLNLYADYVIDMMRSGLFAFVAHPDLFGNCYAEWDANTEAASRDIIAAAADLGVALEINALGLRKLARKKADNPFPMYPWLPFWELAAEYPVEIIVNSDAHRPKDLQAMTAEARAIAEQFGLRHVDPDSIGVRAA